jgi:hypothetical protein
MKRIIGVAVGVGALACMAGSASAVSGSEHVTLIGSDGSTTPKVIAAGVVNAIGTDVPLSRAQGPGGAVSGVDLFVFAGGNVVVDTQEQVTSSVFDPRTCIDQIRFVGTFTVDGGTGAYVNASGSGTVSGAQTFSFPRNPGGGCNTETQPKAVLTTLSASGTLNVPGPNGGGQA